jgi:hypothetical protein
MNKQAMLLLLGAMSSTVTFAQRDHDAAPMLAPAQTAMSEQQFAESMEESGRQQSESSILKSFRLSFPNKPRVAVFWNREFPHRVSDWYSNTRTSVNAKGKLLVQGGENPREETGRGSISEQHEYRGGPTANSHSNNVALSLQSGLIRALNSGGATVIDQSMARRITDNALEGGTFERSSPDQLRLQMRALAKHADYVLELVIGSNYVDDGLYQVRVLSIKDASILTTFSTQAKPPESETESAWVVAGSGFEKRNKPVPAEVYGREIALRTMANMSQ